MEFLKNISKTPVVQKSLLNLPQIVLEFFQLDETTPFENDSQYLKTVEAEVTLSSTRKTIESGLQGALVNIPMIKEKLDLDSGAELLSCLDKALAHLRKTKAAKIAANPEKKPR